MQSSELPASIGKYKIECILGKGAMGLVYKAFDTNIDRTVALKVLHRHLLEGEQGKDFEQRFIQEAKAAARCLHPNIVTIFDFGVQDGMPFIVMEYIDGVELKDQLQSGKSFSFVVVLDIISQVLEALAYAHHNGVVHRDIKPANIMLMDNGRVKVSDFGVARLDNSELTSTGMMVGTPNYMSPEGMHGFQVDNRSDLYSVGVLLFELLTGQRPYSGLSLDEAVAPLDACETIDPLNRVRVRPIILKALQGKPAQRFQDAAAFLEALISIMSESGSEQGTVIYQPTKVVRIAKNITADTDQTGSIATLHPDVLSSIESSLIRFVGPSAKVLIKKYSKDVRSLEELSMTLAKKIPNDSERAEFLRALETSGVREAALSLEAKSSSGLTRSGVEQNGARSMLTEPLQLSPEKLQSVTSELAFFIGPLAGRLVKKIFKQSSNIDEFYSKLAGFIPEPSEQADFLNRVK
jgi:serine/threonine-protein kinase